MSTEDKQNADKLLLEKIKAISHSVSETSSASEATFFHQEPNHRSVIAANQANILSELNSSVLLPGEQLKLSPSHITGPSTLLPAEEYNIILEVNDYY